MRVRWAELMLMGLLAWTAIGAVGLAIHRRRGDRRRFRGGLLTIAGVWALYIGVLIAVSLREPAPILAAGQARCFGRMCFAVAGAEELPGFLVRGQDRERLLRVAVRIEDRGTGDPVGEPGLVGTLVDAQGRRWEQVPGLSGVRLSTPVAAGGTALSEPVFRVARNATGLRLRLHHRQWTWSRLVIGDAESYLHRPAEMLLTPAPVAGANR